MWKRRILRLECKAKDESHERHHHNHGSDHSNVSDGQRGSAREKKQSDKKRGKKREKERETKRARERERDEWRKIHRGGWKDLLTSKTLLHFSDCRLPHLLDRSSLNATVMDKSKETHTVLQVCLTVKR